MVTGGRHGVLKYWKIAVRLGTRAGSERRVVAVGQIHSLFLYFAESSKWNITAACESV
jgi:hypothetical protein